MSLKFSFLKKNAVFRMKKTESKDVVKVNQILPIISIP